MIDLQTFHDRLSLVSANFDIPPAVVQNRTIGGGVSTTIYAEPLWQGEGQVSVADHTSATRRDLIALSRRLREGEPFLVNDPTKLDPLKGDPDMDYSGLAIGDMRNGRELQLTGAPAGLRLMPGDLLSWQHGNGLYAMHEIAEAVTIGGDGGSGWFGVYPRVRIGWDSASNVRLRRPQCKAVVTDFSPGGYRAVIQDGFSFSWVQTLK